MFYKLLNAYTRQFSFPHTGLKYFLKTAKWLGISNKTYNKKLANNFYMQVNPSEHIQQQLFWYGYYEQEIGDLIKKILKPNDVFLDIGANIGYFSLLAAIHQPSAKIISFEPVTTVFKLFEENISLNNVSNITAINAAAGEKEDEREIYISTEDNTGMSSFQKPENYSGKKEKVKVIAIDSWFRHSGLSKIDLVKIDIEGSELSALNGMNEMLLNFKPLLIVEINPDTLRLFNHGSVDIINLLKQLGFDGFLISKTGKLETTNKNLLQNACNVLFIHNEKVKLYDHLF